jgi:hypothetical protein
LHLGCCVTCSLLLVERAAPLPLPPPTHTHKQVQTHLNPAPPALPGPPPPSLRTSLFGSDCSARVDAMWMMLLPPAAADADTPSCCCCCCCCCCCWLSAAISGSSASLSRKGADRFTADNIRGGKGGGGWEGGRGMCDSSHGWCIGWYTHRRSMYLGSKDV